MTSSSQPSAVTRLLRPRSVAIIGASADPLSASARVLGNLDLVGFSGTVHLVSRRAREIGGRACVASIDDLPPGIDAAVLVVPEAAVADAVAGCVARGIGGAVVFAAGFAETGPEGRDKQQRIAAIARDGGFALDGPNCMGFTNFLDRVSFSFGAVETEVLAPGPGGAAIIAQSGAMMGNIAAALGAKGVPVNYTISTGNEAVTSAEDFLAAIIDDPQTGIFVLFMEQIRRPASFLALVEKARALGKPVLLMHPGSSERGRASARSHTGALAGNHAAMEAVLRHHGVVLVDTMDELIDAGVLLARWPRGAEKGAAIISNSGAVRGISLDFGERIGLPIPKLSPESEAALRPIVPAYVPVDNPLDLATAGMGQADIYGKTARIMLADEAIGCAILAMVPGTPQLQMAKGRSLVPMILAEAKPVAFVMLGDEVKLVDEFTALVTASRIPFFRSPDRAMRAMAHVVAQGRRQRSLRDARPAPAAPALGLDGAGPLPEYRAKSILAAAGIGVPAGALASDLAAAQAIAARIGFPVAMKIQAAAITHKTELGGVELGILAPEMLAVSWERLHAKLAQARPDIQPDGVLVEKMHAGGLEMIIGARRDPEWGPVLVVGLGGVWSEALDDVRLMPAGLGVEAIEAELRRLKSAKVLSGLRGAPSWDIAAAARAAERLGALMLANPEIEDMEINPLSLAAAGMGATALDALIILRETPVPLPA
ncbi:MAG TPA: acetate--CoA ligase family protein [Stellaceae bacterium]|nr:acetate--CoA ligase family protein [Stellaceae bacterium]